MSAIGRAAIKAYFEGGDIPSEDQYIDTWDSFFNLTDDTTGNLGVTSIQFDPTPTGVPTDSEGLMYFNSTSKTMNLVLDGGVVMQIGQELPIYVKNTSGSTVNDGNAVYVAGSTGINLIVGLADASDLTKSSQVGLVTTASGIAHNGFGFVARFGAVRGLDASGTPVSETWDEGELLYLSATTPGTLSNSAPGTPHFTVEMGVVVNNSATVGVIGVDPKMPHAADVALGTSDLVGPTQGAVKAYVDAGNAILHKDMTDHAHTGDTDVTIVKTYSMPIGTLSASGGLRITAAFNATSGSYLPQFFLFFGSTNVIGITTLVSTESSEVVMSADVFNVTASTQRAMGVASGRDSGGNTNSFTEYSEPAEDTTATVDITAKVATDDAGETVTLKMFTVEQLDA